MKNRLILFFCLTLSNIYSHEKVEEISYTSVGRGFREVIIVRQDSTFVDRRTLKDTLSKRSQTSAETWVRLKNSISNYHLSDLQNLPCPTNHRASDGAMYSNIKISTPKKIYDCGQFDSHTPNEKLKETLEILLENLQ